MPKQKPCKCKQCGDVLGVASEPLSCMEIVGWSVLSVVTLGIAFIIFIPYAGYRGYVANKFRCPKCGRKAKPRLFG